MCLAVVVDREPTAIVLITQVLDAHENALRFQNVRRVHAEAHARGKELLAQAKRDGSNWSELVTRYTDDANSAPIFRVCS